MNGTAFPHVYSLESEDAYLRTQINAVAGSSLEQILGAGQQPYLYSIGLLQKARRSGTHLDPVAMYLVSTVSDVYWNIHQITILYDREETTMFRDKVWRLYMNFDRSISFAGQPATLSLVEPNFTDRSIQITLSVGR